MFHLFSLHSSVLTFQPCPHRLLQTNSYIFGFYCFISSQIILPFQVFNPTNNAPRGHTVSGHAPRGHAVRGNAPRGNVSQPN